MFSLLLCSYGEERHLFLTSGQCLRSHCDFSHQQNVGGRIHVSVYEPQLASRSAGCALQSRVGCSSSSVSIFSQLHQSRGCRLLRFGIHPRFPSQTTCSTYPPWVQVSTFLEDPVSKVDFAERAVHVPYSVDELVFAAPSVTEVSKLPPPPIKKNW